MPSPTIPELAGQAFDAFTTTERGDETITVRKDDAPEWVGEIVHAAHGRDFLPDDWRYEAIRAAFAHIHDCDVEDDDGDAAHEFADGHADVYTAARFQWLASNLNRQGYVDQAREEGLLAPDSDIAQQVGVGQYVEALEVFHLVFEGLREHAEDLELA